MDYYGTIGPACNKAGIMKQMFEAGMTGMRLNLSHTTLVKAEEVLAEFAAAGAQAGIRPALLVDLQGPELRIRQMPQPMMLREGRTYSDIPLPELLCKEAVPGDRLLLDDGKILGEVVRNIGTSPAVRILRGGLLAGGKSVAVEGKSLTGPVLTEQDKKNLKDAKRYGVTGVMQPFVRGGEDLRAVRQALAEAGCPELKLFAKIENLQGMAKLSEIVAEADEIVIARGDLGNSVPLWKLPALQKQIAAECNAGGKPFMVVTQMLASMEKNAVPTRAEVSDIFNAVLDGASSVMVTGETAVGAYPVEVIRYLVNTGEEARSYMITDTK